MDRADGGVPDLPCGLRAGARGVDLLASIGTARAAWVHRAPADADPGMRSADLQHVADLLPHLIP